MRPALELLDGLPGQLRDRHLGLLLDYDGTLTPIVGRPAEARLSAEMRRLLERLAQVATVAVISGRDRRDVQQMVGVDRLVYAGSHGMDIQGPGMKFEHPQAERALSELDRAERLLRESIAAISGAHVERKRFSIAVHYRQVASASDAGRVESLVDQVVGQGPTLRKMGGKKVFEIQPDIPWDKGEAALWIAGQLQWSPQKTLIIYIGDDVTDEFAFRALRQRQWGMGIRVGDPSESSEALFYLRDCDQVRVFLEGLLAAISDGSDAIA